MGRKPLMFHFITTIGVLIFCSMGWADQLYELDIRSSNFYETEVFFNDQLVGRFTEAKNYSLPANEYVSRGKNQIKICFHKKIARQIPARALPQVVLRDMNRRFANVFQAGGEVTVKAPPIVLLTPMVLGGQSQDCVRSEYQHEGKDFRNLALLEKVLKGESPSKIENSFVGEKPKSLNQKLVEASSKNLSRSKATINGTDRVEKNASSSREEALSSKPNTKRTILPKQKIVQPIGVSQEALKSQSFSSPNSDTPKSLSVVDKLSDEIINELVEGKTQIPDSIAPASQMASKNVNPVFKKLFGAPKKVSVDEPLEGLHKELIGSWKDEKTGVVYEFLRKKIKLSIMPKGFSMKYKFVKDNRIRVRVLKNKFFVDISLVGPDKMIYHNRQTGESQILKKL